MANGGPPTDVSYILSDSGIQHYLEVCVPVREEMGEIDFVIRVFESDLKTHCMETASSFCFETILVMANFSASSKPPERLIF